MAELTAQPEMPSAPATATGDRPQAEQPIQDPGQDPSSDGGLGSGATDWEPQPPPETPPEPVVPELYGPEPTISEDQVRFEDRVAKMGGLEALQEYQRTLNAAARREGRDEPYEVSPSMEAAYNQYKADVEALQAEGVPDYKQRKAQEKQQAELNAWLRALPPALREAYLSGGEQAFENAADAYNKRIAGEWADFERQLSGGPRELWDAYYRGGVAGYEKAAAAYRDAVARGATVRPETPDAYKNWTAYELLNGKIEDGVYTPSPFGVKGRTQVALPEWAQLNVIDGIRQAQTALEPYRVAGGIDVTAALRAGVPESVLETAGIGRASITQALVALRQYGPEIPELTLAQQVAELRDTTTRWNSQLWQGLTPWDESRGETVTPLGAVTMAAELALPGVYVARRWDDLSAPERAFVIMLDVVSLLPFLAAPARGARAVGTVGKAARLQAAAKALGREGLMAIRAPIDLVIHPTGAIRSGVGQVKSLVTNIAHPRKLPEASIATANGTTRLPITRGTDAAAAMAIRDRLVELALSGERPRVIVGNRVVELRRSPLMRELKGGMAHSTPFGEQFGSGSIVVEGGNLFWAHEPMPRFALSTSTGLVGERKLMLIVEPGRVKSIRSGKTYKRAAEMERKSPLGTRVPTTPDQVLVTHVGPEAQRVEIRLVGKRLSPLQIARIKAAGPVELLKAPFVEPISVKTLTPSKLARLRRERIPEIRSLSTQQVEEVVKALRSAGRAEEAAALRRVVENPRIAREAASGRAASSLGARAATYVGQLGRTGQITVDMPRYRLSTAGSRSVSGSVVTQAATITPVLLERVSDREYTPAGERVSRQPSISRADAAPRTGRGEDQTRSQRVREDTATSRAARQERYQRLGSVPREPVRETPRGTPREPPRAPIREIPRDTPREPPRAPPSRQAPPTLPPRAVPPTLPPRAAPLKGGGRRPPLGGVGVAVGAPQERIPAGSIAYKKGLFWKWIPPEDFLNGAKPRTLPRGVSPIGADLRGGSNSPYDTIQRIGDSDAPVPNRITIDEGVVDAVISLRGGRIEYSGSGLGTDVGVRLPSPARGMTIDAEEGVSRPAIAERDKPERGRTSSRPRKHESVYLDEDENWLGSLDPPIVRPSRRTRSTKRRQTRSDPTRLKSIRP